MQDVAGTINSIKCEMIPSCSQVECVGGNDPMARMLSISPSVTGQKLRLTQEERQHHCDPRGVQADVVEGKDPMCCSPKLGQLWAQSGGSAPCRVGPEDVLWECWQMG